MRNPSCTAQAQHSLAAGSSKQRLKKQPISVQNQSAQTREKRPKRGQHFTFPLKYNCQGNILRTRNIAQL